MDCGSVDLGSIPSPGPNRDIYCGVYILYLSSEFREIDLTLEKFKQITNIIGFRKPKGFSEGAFKSRIYQMTNFAVPPGVSLVEILRMRVSLGYGNHFIELGKTLDPIPEYGIGVGDWVISIHTGSREAGTLTESKIISDLSITYSYSVFNRLEICNRVVNHFFKGASGIGFDLPHNIGDSKKLCLKFDNFGIVLDEGLGFRAYITDLELPHGTRDTLWDKLDKTLGGGRRVKSIYRYNWKGPVA